MIELFTNPDKYNANDLIELLTTHDTLLIADRGFDGFREWLEDKEQFRSIKIKLPCTKHIESKLKQFYRKDADESRTYVTAIRSIVECIHGGC